MDILAKCLTALKNCHHHPSDRTIWQAEFELKSYIFTAGDNLESRSQAVDALEKAWRNVDPALNSPLVADFIDKTRRKLVLQPGEA